MFSVVSLLINFLPLLVLAVQTNEVSSEARLFQRDICGLDVWPTYGPGIPLTAQIPNEELTSILDEIDPVRIEAIINKLVSFGTRSTISSQTDPKRGIGAARDWLLSQYQEFAKASNGRMVVELQV